MSGFSALVGQGVLLLALIALVGVAIGWSFGSLRASRTTAERYEQQLRATLRRMSEAEADVVTLRATLQEQDGTIATQEREHESQEHLLAALEARLAEAETAAQDARRPADTAPEPAPAPAASNGDGVAGIVARTAGDSPPADDDLTQIKGIGNVIQRKLKDLGFTSFAQIARFGEADIAIVEDALESFPGRIERDDWIAAARALHKETHGSEI